MDTDDIVDALMQNDNETATDAFNNVIANKIADALQVRRVEIASTLLTPPEETVDDSIGTESETDGSESAEAE